MRVAEANYYRALGAGFGVEVKHIDERQGKGCFAVSSFEDRAVVFRDCSLACLQSRKQTALHEGTLPLSLTAYHRPPFNLCPPPPKAAGCCAEYRRPVATCEHCHRFVGSLWLQLALLSCGEAVTLRVDAATAGGGDALQAPSLPTPTLPSRPSLPRRPPSPLPCSPARHPMVPCCCTAARTVARRLNRSNCSSRPGHLPRCSGSSSSTQMPLEIASSSLRQSSSTPS